MLFGVVGTLVAWGIDGKNPEGRNRRGPGPEKPPGTLENLACLGRREAQGTDETLALAVGLPA
jgi:hypothetical protein